MLVRFLHLADIHLGKIHRFLPENLQEIRTQEIFDSFIRTVQRLIDTSEPPDGIIISGDLFDSPSPDVHLLGKVITFFRQLENRKIPIFLVPGNHDNAISPNSVYRREKFPGVYLLDAPNIAEPLEIEIKDKIFHFYGMAFGTLSRAPFDKFIPRDRSVYNISVIHGSLKNSPDWKLHNQDVPLGKSNLFASGFHYHALGHYHAFQHYEKNGCHIVYPGTFEPLGWGEDIPRTIVMVEFYDQELAVRTYPIDDPFRFYKTIELDVGHKSFRSSEDIADHVDRKFRDTRCILQIKLKGQSDFLPQVDRILGMLDEKFFYVKIEDQTFVTSWEKLEQFRNENTIRGLAIRKILAKMEKKGDTGIEKKALQDSLKILMNYFTLD